ncbi:ABC transporter ATP-binding protein [Salaquimonas pukyongi]|uniref:ABC transporter ATP-binding protein n=1 Tax=Salaquimonas pukyongi TaxID=2712698 RepID=UPI0019672E1C|nr:ABC transporter ATP-binding protein [Salaquimonas pukyongi]
MTEPLISVKDLTIRFNTDEGLVTAVENISFDIAPGEVLGLVGESGSGKSVTAKALMQLNAGNTRYDEKSSIILDTEDGKVDVLSLKKPGELRVVRGGAVSMIFQEPMASFAPAITIGDQMVEQLLIHTEMTKAEAKKHSVDMLARVGIPEPERRFGQYAFEFSGGMRQRAMIAMALSTRPKLLIADEPTTALDVTIQAQVIDLMKDLVEEFHMAILFITHDLGVIAQTADRVAVMYLGELVETGEVRQVIREPHHPYTQGLLNALPKLDDLEAELTPVPGDIPSPLERPSGCVFHTRCPVMYGDRCTQEIPQLLKDNKGRLVACHLVEEKGVQTKPRKAKGGTKKGGTRKGKAK